MLKPAALAALLLWPLSGHAADKPEKPDVWFCLKARAHRALFPTDKAAEADARAQGATSATIAKAYRCRP